MNVQIRNQIEGCVPITPTRLVSTPVDNVSQYAVTAAKTPFRYACVQAWRSQTVPNQGVTFWGPGPGGNLALNAILPGEVIEVVAPPGAVLDLSDFQLQVSVTGDVLVIDYY